LTAVEKARNGDVELAYQRVGDQAGEPLLLIMGLGMQMIAWPDGFCEQLTTAGFAVARMDNRDAGESTQLRGASRPSLLTTLTRPATAAVYTLTDMADDAVAVLDALGWESAHVVGASLGGMIAQTLAVRHPKRVRTLTSMMSTPSPRIGRATPKAMRALFSKPAAGRAGVQDRSVAVFRVIGSPGYPLDETVLREMAGRAFDRGGSPSGSLRQLAALRSAGDRRADLAGVRVPALVIHGEKDPLIRPSGGRATAAAIPGARLVVFPGMGHDLPAALWPSFVSEIASLASGS
jgi:pimeloyl-ACP methyl ester carboxylesterase